VNAALNLDDFDADEFNRQELSFICSESPLTAFKLRPSAYGTNSLGMITSVMWTNEQKCTRCDGEGVDECDCCGHERECHKCDGEGVIESSSAIITRCDGFTTIKIINRDVAKRILENGCEDAAKLVVSKDAWEVI